MRLLIKNALIYNSDTRSFVRGDMLCEDGLIREIGDLGDAACDTLLDAQGKRLIPGFIDIHTHGRAGFDFCTAEGEQIHKMKQSYLSCGVTSAVPTLASDTVDNWLAATERIGAAREGEGTRLVGLHLEGRYLNPSKRGVQSAQLLTAPDTAELEAMLARAGLPLHVSYAPELDEDGSFASFAGERGITLSAGHTALTYEQAKLAEQRGVGCYTHLFNAMNGLHHREGGPVCAALEGDAYAELICDGMHVSPGVVRLVYKCKGSERLVLVSDSMEGAGMPDGEYTIAGVPVYLRDGRAVDAEGHLGGSTLDMLGAVKNLMSFCNITLEEALPCATSNPASVVGIYHRVGSLEVGKYADALLLSEDMAICATVLGGQLK